MKKSRIDFETQDVEMPDLDLPCIRSWIVEVAGKHGYEVGRLLYVFMDDPGILRANIEALGHDYFTDIITFDYTRQNTISGEMLISLDTVRSNADLFRQDYKHELLRVIIHGVLHLTGINDKGPGEREIMERAENEALEIFDGLTC